MTELQQETQDQERDDFSDIIFDTPEPSKCKKKGYK